VLPPNADAMVSTNSSFSLKQDNAKLWTGFIFFGIQ
jgi:hypothetical protein